MIAAKHADQYPVRFPPGLRDRVKAAAQSAGRSMNTEIVMILERALSGEEAAGTSPEKANPAAIRHSALQGAATTHG